MTINKLQKNNDKTEMLLCGKKSMLNSINNNSATIGGETIIFSSNVENLGIVIDEHLSMDCAVSYIRKSCFRELGKIGKIRSYIDENAAKKLVLTLVMSRLDYCNSLFFNMTNDNIYKLQLIQNHAARLVKQASKRSSASALLHELHWLPVKKRIVYKIAVLTYNCVNDDSSPVYLKYLIHKYTPSRHLRSSSKNQLIIPSKNLKTFGERSFSYAAPVVWNSLPEYVKASTSLNIFKKRLKTHLFTSNV